jgi:imidazoleglycerol-phosphate dehydratase
MSRNATISRSTTETQIELALELDGTGTHTINTPVPFLSHMLAQIAKHGSIDLTVKATGDTEIDDHHTVEDIGLCLGAAVNEALGERRGIERFGSMRAPLDEALVEVTLDLSGRPYLVYEMDLPKTKLGSFDVELIKEFYQAFSVKAACNLHVRRITGSNLHHTIEASFKAFALALRNAIRITRSIESVPSTKGHLD